MKYREGDLVIISDSAFEYKKKYNGLTGRVVRIFKTRDCLMYAIHIDGKHNKSSKDGVFWYHANSLKLHHEDESSPDTIESEEIFMSTMFENFKVAEVQFLNDPVPVHYYAIYDEDIFPEDTVVVRTGHHGFALAKIHAIHEGDDPELRKLVKHNRQVVSRVDFTAYNKRKEVLAKSAELQKSMAIRAKEVQTLCLYEMLAEKDPAMREMLDNFKSLQSLISGGTIFESEET